MVGLILYFLVGPRWPGFGMVGDYRMMGLCMGIWSDSMECEGLDTTRLEASGGAGSHQIALGERDARDRESMCVPR